MQPRTTTQAPPTMTITDEISAAKAVIASHEDLSRAGDLAGVLTNIADDIVLIVPNTPLVEGKSAFEEVYANMFGMGQWDFKHHYSGEDVIGDVVVLYGVARGTFTPTDGDSSPIKNNFLIALKRIGDTFKVWRGAFAPAS